MKIGSLSLLQKKNGDFTSAFRYREKSSFGQQKAPILSGLFAAGDIFFVSTLWPARRDSNPRPLESESTAISSFATGGNLFLLSFPGQQKLFYTIFPDLASAFFTFFAAAFEIPPFALAMPRTRLDDFSKKPNIQAENAVNFPHGKSVLLSQR